MGDHRVAQFSLPIITTIQLHETTLEMIKTNHISLESHHTWPQTVDLHTASYVTLITYSHCLMEMRYLFHE